MADVKGKANKVRKLLKSRGKTLSDIARGTNLSVSQISRVFSLRRRPSIDCATRVAAYLGIGVNEFLDAYLESKEAERQGC